jgi:ABC-type nitrate/sulfonate/bicarbonate transport system substrate-binding protein
MVPARHLTGRPALGRRQILAGGAALASAAKLIGKARAATPRLRMVVFSAPSLGAFLPPIIAAQGFDAKNDLAIDFVERPPDAYTVAFNTGEFELGGSAAPLTIGLADARGVEVTYLFNLFDYWGTVVTARPEIKTVADLEGRDLAAARGTTNYTMFLWFARKMGADPAKFAVVNTTPAGLITYAMTDRAAAVQIWEPAYTLLKARKPEIRRLDLKLREHWQDVAGTPQIPYLGVAAQRGWVARNAALIPRLEAAYRDAAAWLLANPEAAAKLIAPRGSDEERQAIVALVRANDRLGLNIRAAGALRGALQTVYRAGMEVGFLPRMPDEATIYRGTNG